MAVVVTRQKSVHFDLSPAECETPHLKELLFDKLTKMYNNTCMDSSYILYVTRIIGEPSPRVWNPRKMNGEMSTSVLFEYKAEIIVGQSEVKTQSILHAGRVIEIDDIGGDVLAMCTFGNHTTGTILINLHGIVNVDMLIPVRVSNADYPQRSESNVNVAGELLQPTHFNPRYMIVTPGTEAEMINARNRLSKLNMYIAQVTSHKRTQYFKAWLYPYKTTIDRKSMTLASLLSKRQTKAMYVRLDDTCDIANLEFLVVSKVPLADKMTFMEFVVTLIEDAQRMWGDIETFSTTYEDEDVFSAHKTIWNYYENGKFTYNPDLEPVPKAIKRASKKAHEEPESDILAKNS